jgi:hypothetical protein
VSDIEAFDLDFWNLLRIAKNEPASTRSLDDLSLENKGYIEKRMVSEPADSGLLGSFSPGDKYKAYLTQKGKAWVSRWAQMDVPSMLKQICLRHQFSWGCGLLQVSAANRWIGPYQTMGDRGEHTDPRKFWDGMVSIGLLSPIRKPGYPHAASLTPKGKYFLKRVADKNPHEILDYMLDRQRSREYPRERIATIRNLRLVERAIRGISPKEWFPLLEKLEPVQRRTDWQNKQVVTYNWHRGIALNLVIIAQDCNNFRRSIPPAVKNWEWLFDNINPAIINIIATKPDFKLEKLTPYDILEKSQLLYKTDACTLETLIKYQPEFVATINSVPLSDWAVILAKLEPANRKILGKVLKRRLADSEASCDN